MQLQHTNGYDYEIFVGPFSTHVYSRADVFYTILTAVDLGMISYEEGQDATRIAFAMLSGKDNSVMRGVNMVTIHDRAIEKLIHDKAMEEAEHGDD